VEIPHETHSQMEGLRTRDITDIWPNNFGICQLT